jgi:hypothetical protein
MKRLTVVVGLLGVLLATTAFGQGRYFLQTRIPFEFVAADKTFPAGKYDFRLSDHSVEMTNHDTGKHFSLPFLTSMAADKTAQGTARISFDVQDGKHFIEAVWPENSDGYLIRKVEGEHTREIIRSK